MTLPSHPGNTPEGSNPQVGTTIGESSATKPVRKTGMIAGASVLALAVLVGGGYAVANTMNAASDKDTAKVMPANTGIYAEMDLNPSNGQKIGFISVVNKINSLSDEEEVATDTDPKELATDLFFEELDYETEVKPWIGDKVAGGAWGDLSGTEFDEVDDFTALESADLAMNVTDSTGVEAPPTEDPSAVVVYETTDATKATEAAEKAITGEGGTVFAIHEDYLVVASTDKALEEYLAGVKEGSLADNEEFKADRKALGIDAVATGWVDIEKTGIDASDYADYANYYGLNNVEDAGHIEGRIITGLTFTENGASNVTKMIDFNSENYDASLVSDTKGFEDIENLPGNSIAALGFVGLDEGAKKLWEQKSNTPEGSDPYSEIGSGLEQYGVTLPDDFTRLLGSETNFAFASSATNAEQAVGDTFSGMARFSGGDVSLWQSITKDGLEENINAFDEDGVAVVSYNGHNHNSSGKLSENKLFSEATGDLSEAQVVGYVDLSKVSQLSGEEKTDYGSIGLNASHDKEKNVTDVTIKWVF